MKIKECVLIEPFICDVDLPIVDVAKKLRTTTLRHIFVVNKDNEPAGIISVLDINNRLVAEGRDYSQTLAKDIMSKPVESFNLEEDTSDVGQKMLSKAWAMSPVVDENNKMVGIVTINQVLKNEPR
ncbi:hypothetical protein COV20_00565 [Candidatus Woesearchaeota archaeon CG10_big_fil_rev_8_21_14_0_10_45_16]|nr:MAG: hypothetical protein COV20_00565 [Candidatus Woesearchaeota archaeon CG10_big_fil_rev_8_21_14_0_10_45_16]